MLYISWYVLLVSLEDVLCHEDQDCGQWESRIMPACVKRILAIQDWEGVVEILMILEKKSFDIEAACVARRLWSWTRIPRSSPGTALRWGTCRGTLSMTKKFSPEKNNSPSKGTYSWTLTKKWEISLLFSFFLSPRKILRANIKVWQNFVGWDFWARGSDFLMATKSRG